MSRAEDVLAECLSERPSFAGADEDVEFYAVSAGLAPLNTALIQSKHRYFLRDGRDGVEGRAPGGYVEYILGTWLRTLRFLQALRSAAERHGLPSGARLIAGTVGLGTDLACILGERKSRPDATSSDAAPVATLTLKKWTPRPDPLADIIETGSAIRRKIAEPQTMAPAAMEPADSPEPNVDAVPVAAEEPIAVSPVAMSAPVVEPRRGFFARLFARRRKA